MGDISTAARLAFRDWVTDGVPASGVFKPIKSGIRSLFDLIDSMYLAAFGDALADIRTFGIKADGIKITATVTIGLGSTALTAVGASFTQADVGKTILVGGAGTSGKYLITTIAAFIDATHVILAGAAATAVTATSKTVRYGTDDTAAWNAAFIAAGAGQFNLLIRAAGMSICSGTVNAAWNDAQLLSWVNKFEFFHAGSGVQISLDGMANYPGTQGCINGQIAGPGRIMLRGNPNGTTTKNIDLNNYHFGYITARMHDAVQCLVTRDTGVVGASAVCTIFDRMQVSTNLDGAMALSPNAGIVAAAVVACEFRSPVIETCGNNSAFAVQFLGAINNRTTSGTVESNAAGGIIEDSTSSRNSYDNVDCEVNGTAEDWRVNGKYPKLDNCSGAGTTAGQTFGSTGAMVSGGQWQSLVNNDNTLIIQNFEPLVAFSNNGSNTIVRNPVGALAGSIACVDNSAVSIDKKLSIKSNNATGGIGYSTGAGGAVTQATSKITGVTLNTVAGQITMNNAALASGAAVTFTLTNSAIAATDIVMVNIKSGTSTTQGAYNTQVERVAAGSCNITLRNYSGGSLGEAVVLQYAIIKGVNS